VYVKRRAGIYAKISLSGISKTKSIMSKKTTSSRETRTWLGNAFSRSKKEDKLLNILDKDSRKGRNSFNNDDLRKIVTENRNLVKKKYKFQCYDKKIHPIVMAYFLGASEDVCRIMYKTYPEVKKSCPLAALILRATLEEFKSTVVENPNDIELTFCGLNFLHIASTFYADDEVIEFLSKEIHPKFFKKLDSTGCTPIALACKMSREFEFIKYLVDKVPQAVQVLNKKKQSPLHYVVSGKKPSLEKVKLLTEIWPEALKTRDEDGDSPLHDALIESASGDVINYLAEECPEMLLVENKCGYVPYILEKRKGKDANSEILSYLGVASFYRKMQEKDERRAIYKINELTPLICDVHVMRLFYTFVNTSFRLDLIDDIDRKRFIKAGLNEAAKTTACTKSVSTFKLIIKKAAAESLITEFEQLELDREAEITHTSHSRFIKDMWAHINANTARIDRLEIAVDNLNDNVQGLHTAVNRIRNAMIHRRKVENSMFFMNVVFSVLAMGAISNNVTKFMSQVVDFGDLDELTATFPEDASIIADASASASVELPGDVQIKDMFGIFANYETRSESILNNDKAWGGCLFSLAFAAGIANRKTIKDSLISPSLEFDIPQFEIPKLHTKTLVERIERIEVSFGMNLNGESGSTVLNRVRRLENTVWEDDFDGGTSTVFNLLERVTDMEKHLFNENESEPLDSGNFYDSINHEKNNENNETMPVQNKATIRNEEAMELEYTGVLEELEKEANFEEETHKDAKTRMIENIIGGDIIPSNHEDFVIDDNSFAKLMDMGFEAGPAFNVLMKCNNDHDLAISVLLNMTNA